MKNIKGAREIASVKDYRNFVPIEGSYYGGYQNWLFTQNLDTKFFANRSCGVVAAANVSYHLSKYHNKTLYDYKDTRLISFTKHIKEISKFICPKVYGIPAIHTMKGGFIEFAQSKNVSVEGFKINLKRDKEKIITDIKTILEKNYPILMISWNSKNPSLRYHWVTITAYYKSKKGDNLIITSNWGKKQIYNLDCWLDEKIIYKGILYFK